MFPALPPYLATIPPIGIVTFLILAWASPTFADAPPKPAAGPDDAKVIQATFDQLVGRIRAAATSGDWKRANWSDATIDGVLTRLVEDAKRATEDPTLELPVKLADVRPGAAAGPPRMQKALLIEQGDVSASFAEDSIILVDGNARVSFANNCVVVARGAVNISHGRGNVVVAGHYVHVSHDGNQGLRAGANSSSILVSGGVIDVSHAKGTVCSAPHLVRISHADGVRFVNSPKITTSHERGQNCPRINNVELASVPEARRNPLEGKFKLTQVVRANDSGKGAMAVLEKDGVEHVVRPGVRINDAAGKPIPGLEDWTLSFVDDHFALFSNGKEDAAFILPER